jgi:hypothetical protein
VKLDGEQRTYLLAYVDDLLMGGELSKVFKAKQRVAECFNTDDLGVAYHFRVFLIHRDEFDIRSSQE